MVISINFSSSTPAPGSTVNEAKVDFYYTIIDNDQGITSIEYSFDGVNYKSVREGDDNENMGSSRFFPPSGTFALTFEHGLHALRFRVVDFVNNVSSVFCYNDTPLYIYDLNIDIFTHIDFNPIPPLLVNESALSVGGTRESGSTVTVKIGSTFFSVTYPTSTTWQSSVILQEESNLIEATATDAGDHSMTVTATVVLDTIAPGAPVVLTISPAMPNYRDQGSPIVATNKAAQIIGGNKEAGTSLWVNDVQIIPLNSSTDFAIPVTLTEGDSQYKIKAKDLAGNFSPETIVLMTLDTLAPYGTSIVINDGVKYTLNRSVVLELKATDATMVKVSEDPNFHDVNYVAFVESPTLMPFELSRGGGTKIVYAIFRDDIGNESEPVYDDIILPSTFSEEVERVGTMTIQELNVDPEDEYLIRMQDDRDGNFSVSLYVDLLSALNGGTDNRLAYANTSTEGEQSLALIPDSGGPTGTIKLTFIKGAEMVIYRYRTDVYDASQGELEGETVYSIVEVDGIFEAKTQVPLFEESIFGHILKTEVEGNKRKLRISKSFSLYDDATIQGKGWDLYPISSARLDYPLFNIPVDIVEIEEEVDTYLVTIKKDFGIFDPTFGYEIMLSKRKEMVTDYRIIKDTRQIEFINESGQASGNVKVTYDTVQHTTSKPSAEFLEIEADNVDDIVKLTVEPIKNLILLSDLDKINIRFYHSLVDSEQIAPDSIDVAINEGGLITVNDYTIVSENSRSQIREYCVEFPEVDIDEVGRTPGPNNPIIEKIDIIFKAAAKSTWCDEVQMIARSSIVSSNCRVVVNGEEKFFSSQSISKNSDLYELRKQENTVDVLCNGKCVHSEPLALGDATVTFGAGGRANGDEVNAIFSQFDTIQHIDSSSTDLGLSGRYVDIEVGLQQHSTLKDFALEFTSTKPQYYDRVYSPYIPSFDYLDVSTVAIIGVGSCEEWLVKQGLGLEDEGQPTDFDPTQKPDGRHFIVKSFPIVTGMLKLIRKHNNVESVLIENVDYHVNEANGEIVLFHPIAFGDSLRAIYESAGDLYKPEIFTDIDKLTDKFGAASTQNTLSLGALLAFRNGAKRVLAVLASRLDQDWLQAYAALAKEEAYFVVPIPSDNYKTIAALGLQHVESQSFVSKRHERILVIGETSDLTENDLLSYRNGFRTIFLQPNQIRTVVSGETLTLDGRYLAAAYAGAFSSLLSPTLPMTNRFLTGFDIASSNYTNVELEQKVSKGITFVKATQGGVRVHRSITTTRNMLPVEQEQSVIRIRDYLSINIRHLLDNEYVGKVIDNNTLGAIVRTTEMFLNSQKDNNIITKWQNVRVKQDSVEPRQVNVTFDVQPVFPLNAIFITVNVVAQV